MNRDCASAVEIPVKRARSMGGMRQFDTSYDKVACPIGFAIARDQDRMNGVFHASPSAFPAHEKNYMIPSKDTCIRDKNAGGIFI